MSDDRARPDAAQPPGGAANGDRGIAEGSAGEAEGRVARDDIAQPPGEAAGDARGFAEGGAGEVEDRAAQDVIEAEAAVQADLDVAKLVAERDDYLDALRRLQADFENYKKRVMKHEADNLERASRLLAEKLLPVLDAFDGALSHGSSDVKPIYDVLMDVLEKEGITVVFPAGEPFDPNVMEAIAHEPGEGDEEGEVVAAVLRTGYLWKGRVLRPALVKTRG